MNFWKFDCKMVEMLLIFSLPVLNLILEHIFDRLEWMKTVAWS